MKALRRFLAVRPLRLFALAFWIIAFAGWRVFHPGTTLLLLAGCIASAVLDIAFQVYRREAKGEPKPERLVRYAREPVAPGDTAFGVRLGKQKFQPIASAEAEEILQNPASLSFVRAVIVCPDCGEFHDIRTTVYGGRLADGIVIATLPYGQSPPGAGWYYRLTGEDRGTTDGLSIPVYRASGRISMGDDRLDAMGYAFDEEVR